MKTRQYRWTAVVALLALAAATPMVWAELAAHDRERLDRAKALHQKELERAATAYHAAVERANATLERQYATAIKQYEQRDAAAAAEALRQELDEAKAAAATVPPPAPQGETPAAAASAAPQPGHAALIQMLGPALTNAEKDEVPSRRLADKDYVLLYFSALWCGPCRAFTPDLVKFHEESAGAGNFEVVLVSSDRSKAAMYQYMKEDKMPWLAVDYGHIKASGLREKYGGPGIPHLVVLDREGNVVSTSYVDGKYVGPRKVVQDVKDRLASAKG